MTNYKKAFIALFIIGAIGLSMYTVGKNKTVPTYTAVEQEPSIDTEEKSTCIQKLEDQTDIAVEKFTGTPSPVDFSSWPEAGTFYTRITDVVATGANFAGHFTIVHWGCGTDCVGYAVVDTSSGEIIDYSPVNENYHLLDYDVDRTSFVLEPVYAGDLRNVYQLSKKDNAAKIELVCSEPVDEDMYR